LRRTLYVMFSSCAITPTRGWSRRSTKFTWLFIAPYPFLSSFSGSCICRRFAICTLLKTSLILGQLTLHLRQS